MPLGYRSDAVRRPCPWVGCVPVYAAVTTQWWDRCSPEHAMQYTVHAVLQYAVHAVLHYTVHTVLDYTVRYTRHYCAH